MPKGKKTQTLSPSEAAAAEVAEFDMRTAQRIMADVRLRVKEKQVVYQGQFMAFIQSHDALCEHLEKLEEVEDFLRAWAAANPDLLAQWRLNEAARKRKHREDLAGGDIHDGLVEEPAGKGEDW